MFPSDHIIRDVASNTASKNTNHPPNTRALDETIYQKYFSSNSGNGANGGPSSAGSSSPVASPAPVLPPVVVSPAPLSPASLPSST